MTPSSFVTALSSIRMTDVFNPYSDVCDQYDYADAAARRRSNLRSYLEAAAAMGLDTVWMGRDLGYRGGRRTGLALTDERHLSAVQLIYPGAQSQRATKGPEIAERTAAEIWSVIRQLPIPPFLWNVFPFHPHEPQSQFTNRKFTSRELRLVDDMNAELFKWLNVRRIVSIGQDAVKYASKFGAEVLIVRHPSYGGVLEFRGGVSNLYRLEISERLNQQGLF